MNKAKLSYIYAGLTILFWGTSATAFKLTLNHLTYVQLLAWASLFSTLILFIILLISGKIKLLKEITQKQVFTSVLLGFFKPIA